MDPQSLAAMLAARGLPANTNVTFARLTSAPGAVPRPATNALVSSVPAQPAVSDGISDQTGVGCTYDQRRRPLCRRRFCTRCYINSHGQQGCIFSMQPL